MQFLYDMFGVLEIIKDVPVYDAASFSKGELIMLGTTDPDSNADHGVAFVTAYTGANTEAVDALGVLQETNATASEVDNLPDAGSTYLKCTVNPGAVYEAEYDQGTSNDVAITTGGVSTTVTITNLEDDIDCGWLFFPLASGGAAGKLRFISAAASGSCTVDSAITTTTSDTIIKIFPQNHRTTDLTADGMSLKSAAAIGSGISIMVIDNYILVNANSEKVPMRYATHKGRDDMSNAKFFAHIRCTDHVYNPTV